MPCSWQSCPSDGDQVTADGVVRAWAVAAACTPPSSRRGREAVGIDYVPAAIEAARAKSQGAARLSYVVGDVTQLPSASLGTFDFFLDIGCFQGPDAGQRLSQGEGVSALANPGATVLLLSFGPSRCNGWSKVHRRRMSKPPSRAGRCSSPSQRTPRAWAGR